MDPIHADTVLYLRAATLEENTSILHCKTTCYYRTTSPGTSTTLEAPTICSIIQSGLIPGGKDIKKGRQAVFFTAVNPMFIDHYGEKGLRRDDAQNCSVQTQLEIHRNTVHWCDLRVAQRKGQQFYQTQSNGIILYNTSPAMCIKRVVVRKSGRRRIVQQNVSISHCTAKSCTEAELELCEI